MTKRGGRLWVMVAAALIVLAGLAGDLAGWTAVPNTLLADWRFSLRTVGPTQSVALVDIDAKSLDAIGVWPWPRALHAQLLDRLAALGAAQIAFDVDFSTRSTPSDDQAFADALARSDAPVFLASFAQKAAHTGGAVAVNEPLPVFLDSAVPALVNVPLGVEGKVRRFPTALVVGKRSVQSMPALLSGMDTPGEPIRIDYGIDARALAHYSYTDVLAGQIPAGALAGKTVIVGATALELRDFFSVPRFGTVPGAVIIALATETLLQHRGLVILPPWWLTLGVALAGLFVTVTLSPFRALGLLVALALGAQVLSAYLQLDRELILGSVGAEIVLGLLAALVLAREYGLRRLLLTLERMESANTRRLLERVVDDGYDGIVILDEHDRPVRINDRARTLLGSGATPGATKADAIGLPRPMQSAIAAARLRQGLGANPRQTGEVVTASAAGETAVEFTATAFLLQLGRFARSRTAVYACLTLRDITERRRGEERLTFIAMHDSLTGLLNRGGLAEAMAARPTPLSGTLVYFDLDRFKTINDGLGHTVGDQLLKDIARRAQAHFGAGAALARMGGDEFACVLEDGLAPTMSRIEALLSDLGEPIAVAGHRLSIGASFGLVNLAPAGAFASALRQADLALQEAKRQGGKRLAVFDPAMEATQSLRLELEQDLAGAIDRGEIDLVYQPQFALATGALVGAEALVRWRHPTRGPVPPGLFIPIAEETGLISHITAWVARRACCEAAAWAMPIRIAINISAVDLRGGSVGRIVEDALRGSGLDPHRLELEITETAFVAGGRQVDEAFDSMRALGARFALDDFGTGYSSLSYLRKYPFAKLKIDRSFIDETPFDPDAMALLRSIVMLAQSLGLSTVAEGIETESQRDALALLGCEIGQGYLFSKPIDRDAMRRLTAHIDPLRLVASAV